MSSTSLTQKWLRQNSQSYPHKERVYTDIDAILLRFTSLRPKSDVYTFDDGRTQLLLCVHGLLPIMFRHASYNIPIALWLSRDYPRHPPIAYVVPTQDMLVKPGKYIEVSGRCHIEYIQNWERKDEGCNLVALLEAMQHHFSNEPPVYSKPKNNHIDSSATHPTPTTVALTSSAPAVPPKPGATPLPPTFQQTQHQSLSIHTHPAQSPIPNQRPRLPPHPPADHGTPRYEAVQSTPAYQPSATYVRHPPPGHPPATSPAGPPIQPVSPPYPKYQSPPPPILPSIAQSSQQVISSPPPPPPPPISIPNLLDEESLDDSTLSGTQGAAIPHPPPPPRTLNPELLRLHEQVHLKMTSELGSLSQAFALDAERLRAHQADLLAGEPALRDEMARLEAVRDVCRSVVSRTSQAVLSAEANVAESRRKGDPEVDELVCSTTIVYNQLINLVAEDNAIEDTIYHLHRALNTGRVDLERFLRTTRILAEEQFTKRALIAKIQAGIPMMDSGWV